MSTVLNDRDAILQAATVRIVNPKNAWINLQSSAPGFHLNAAGQVDLGVVTVTADLVGLDDAVTFSATGATLSNAGGRSVDVTYGGQTAIVTATVVSNGDEFKRSLVIPVLRDGASGTGTPGAPGARGAGHYYATGSTWSDVVAQAACPGSTPVLNDVVTISSSTYAMEKRWTGSAWVENGVVIPGNLIVPGSILGSAIMVGTLDVRAPDGTVILAANSSLANQTKVNQNLVPALVSWPTSSRYGGAQYGFNAGNPNFINGQCAILPPLNGNPYVGYESDSLGIQPNVWFTVSFDGHSYPGNREFCVDVFGPNVDLPGVYGYLTPTKQHFVFTDIMTVAEAAQARLRIFAMGGDSTAEVYNVKVEIGRTETAWCDSVITPANSGKVVMPNSITNTQIGGDLSSTNWNGYIDYRGAGWLMQRNGTLYCFALRARGAISGGDYTSDYGWVEGDRPDGSKKRGFHLSEGGLLLGNRTRGGYCQITDTGDIYTPNINSVQGKTTINGDVTLNGSLLINPRISQPVLDTFAYTVAGGGGVSGPNGQLGNSVTLTVSGNNGPHKIVWNFARLTGGPPSVQVMMDVADGGRTAGIGATASNTTIAVQISAIITGTDGRTLNYSDVLTLTFGSV